MKKGLTWGILSTVIILTFISCNGNDPQADYASIIAGTYTGTVTTGIRRCRRGHNNYKKVGSKS